ncbi:polysaccharide pyruvyl transferase family protein [Stappia indica]|uniref:polysaccharide pyruvyl transferase family protein n=1 Tax=Stappia indica TaxID=538381 RepID=UPI001CD47A5C|nr:polysaccharide pyruvyl transferase family protein [Stappia indica]MCA1298839.1 polysaccharide pyruvyl transferase family protein [Stappia indica]
MTAALTPRRAPLKALHLASFVGNLGDNAMHDGEYRTRAADLPFALDHRPCEVRQFIHWRERAFDAAFIAEANRADLVVIGGFSLFQLWRETTVSGTYLEATPDLFAAIRRPILFHGLGCDATRGVSPLAVERSRSFLDALLAMDHCHFSLRNDGSADLIRDHLGAAYADAMAIVPDGGLFAEPGGGRLPGLAKGSRFIAVNLAGDMPDKRYAGAGGEDLTKAFAADIAKGLNELLAADETLACVFVPHIYSDFGPIGAVLDALDDRLRRERVVVAGLAQGEHGWAPTFDLYRRAEAVVAMRYHACLASMGFGTPVFGIATHHKIAGQFAAYDLAARCHEWREGADLSPLFAELARDLADPAPVRQRFGDIRASERAVLKRYHADLAGWLAGQVEGLS